MTLAQLAAAALLAQAAAPAPGPRAAGQQPVHVEAPEVTWDVAAREARLGGGFTLRRGPLVLRAAEGRYRPADGHVEVTGGALLVDGGRAMVARALRGEVGGVYEAEAPSLFFVDDPASLAAVRTPEEAARIPRRRLTLQAERASGAADGGITLTGVRGTTCGCPDGAAPTWELRARSADVRPGERAILTWPVLWVTPRILAMEKPVPVLALPWLYVPLGQRQSGLLLPELGRTKAAGIMLAEPFYLTLGRSADATAWVGWAFGGSALRGPMGALELRWAPAARAEGKLRVDWLQDLVDEEGGTHGPRVALAGVHGQRLGERSELRAELDLVGDPLYARDFTGDVLKRDATYRRSAVRLARAGDDLALEAGGAWLEPVSRTYWLRMASGLSYGLFGAGLPTFHRGPAVAVRLLPTPLAGPILASGRVELARFGPLSGPTNDAGADGIGPGDLAPSGGRVYAWDPLVSDAGQLDGRWEPGERLAATRGLVRAELSAPFTVGRWLRAIPFLRGAASGYAFDATVDPVANAWAVAGAAAETELTRRFGAFRHAIVPRLEWRAGTSVAGATLPALAYDGWDRARSTPPGAAPTFAGRRLLAAAPPGVYQQGRASVESRLAGPGGWSLRLELGQDFDLRARAAAESFVDLRATLGPLTAETVARYQGFAAREAERPDASPNAWTEVKGAVQLRTTRGYDLHASLRSVGVGGPASIQGGEDALFDLRPTPLPISSQAQAGFKLPIGPATLGYDVLFPGRDVTLQACDTSVDPRATRRVGALHVQQHAASFVWDSPCRCFRLTAQVRLKDCDGFNPKDASFGVGIDLSPREPLGALR